MGYTNNKVMDELKSGGIKLQHETHEPTVIGTLSDLDLLHCFHVNYDSFIL